MKFVGAMTPRQAGERMLERMAIVRADVGQHEDLADRITALAVVGRIESEARHVIATDNAVDQAHMIRTLAELRLALHALGLRLPEA